MDTYVEALKLLSRRRRSSFELSKKLEEKGFSSDEIECALKKCARYLNDEEYAADFIRAQSKKGVGPQVIAFKMKQKFNMSLNVKIDQEEGILQILKKSKSQKLLKTAEGKQKLLIALRRKGFTDLELIYRLVYKKPF